MNWSNKDIEKLINLYEINVFMYDVTTTDYHNRHRRFFRTRSHLVRKIGAESRRRLSAPISGAFVISFMLLLSLTSDIQRSIVYMYAGIAIGST